MFSSHRERGLNVEVTQNPQKLPFNEWAAILTLCLAPLIAHLIAGAPQVVLLHNSQPKWHDSMAIYNPLSIMWRYYAIAERGISTMSVSSTELAAVNVVYWTKDGWSGEEEYIRQGQSLCIRSPPRVVERIISAGGLKTVIVAIQGVAAVGSLVPGALSSNTSISLADIFMGLALLGLSRMPAAYWLTDDYHIIHLFDSTRHQNDQQQILRTQTLVPLLQKQGHKVSSFPAEEQVVEISPNSPSRYSIGLGAIVVRIIYMSLALLLLGLAMYQIVPTIIYDETLSLTAFWMAIGYTLYALSGACIYLPYFCKRNPQSLCMPCVNEVWYKALSAVFAMVAIGGLVAGCLETSRRLDGKYTSYPPFFGPGSWQCVYSHPNGTEHTDDCLTWGVGVYDWVSQSSE